MNRRRPNSIQKTLKDYIVPIIWGILVLVLIFSLFSWNNENKNDTINTNENILWLEVSLDSDFSKATVVYPWDYKKEVEWEISLYKGEKITVQEWSISISTLNQSGIKLNKHWELKYLENWDFALYSGDMWLNSLASTNLEMRFAKITIWENSHISFSQNEMWSTVYLISWFAEVTNLVWESTVLSSGKKITISRSDASNEEVDLSLLKENLDEYFLRSDWFIVNNGSSFLEEVNNDETEEGSEKIKTIPSSNRIITFNNLSDESNVSSDSIEISWNFTNEEIIKITLNGKNALLNKDSKTFKFENIDVSNSENDLVFKIFDDSNDMLSRFVYTVYYEWATSKNNTTSKFNVQTFDVDGSQFIFTTIKDWVSKNLNWKTTYTTTWDFLTLYWQVKTEWIKNVSVNWYTLQSYNWSTWRYHPSVINNNLSIWTNAYEVKYYDEAWKVVYTNHFTIIKKSTQIIKEKTTLIISWEAKTN